MGFAVTILPTFAVDTPLTTISAMVVARTASLCLWMRPPKSAASPCVGGKILRFGAIWRRDRGESGKILRFGAIAEKPA